MFEGGCGCEPEPDRGSDPAHLRLIGPHLCLKKEEIRLKKNTEVQVVTLYEVTAD